MIPPTIAEASRQIAAGRLSPVELTKACLDRIEKLDPRLSAFITVTPERALEDARASEARIVKNGPKTPLDGIPIGHKDLFNTAGILTTANSRLLQANVPASDAAVVKRLADAGTAMLGKLATLEFALAGPSFDLPWAPTRNPWNTEHFTSGSSSGTAAAVAVGMVLGGTGTDTGGSIRGPAAMCGVSGIKPTFGRCSTAGVFPLAHTLDTTGPMAWTAEDCAMLLQAMAGFDPADPSSADVAVPDFRADIGRSPRGLSVGVIRHFHDVDHPVSAATSESNRSQSGHTPGRGRRNPGSKPLSAGRLHRREPHHHELRGCGRAWAMAEIPLHGIWGAHAVPVGAGRHDLRSRLHSGPAAQARAIIGVGSRHG